MPDDGLARADGIRWLKWLGGARKSTVCADDVRIIRLCAAHFASQEAPHLKVPGLPWKVPLPVWRTAPDELPSPILHLKNVFGDRGVFVAKAAGLTGPGPAERILTRPSNPSLSGCSKLTPEAARRVVPLADAVLDCSAEVLRRAAGAAEGDGGEGGSGRLRAHSAYRALQSRMPYVQMGTVTYGAEGALSRHVDGMGGWLVLFSVGFSAEFYIDGQTLLLESGDAIVMNASLAHDVEHGVERVYPYATLGGTPLELPEELRNAVGATRAVVQARQRASAADHREWLARYGPSGGGGAAAVADSPRVGGPEDPRGGAGPALPCKDPSLGECALFATV